MRLYGTPLVYRGRIHVAGLRPTIASSDRIEAWHVSLDPATGRVESATLLGAGGPVRAGRDDEAMPASCAAAHGRVVVVTSLGIAAAVDAATGRTIWSCRYDRGRPDGDDLGHRLDATIETTERRSSFVNEPPVISDGRCFLAPTDARYVFAIADRPRGRARALRLWQRHRVDDFRNLAVEQVVGVVGAAYADTPMLVLAGQGYEGEGSPHTAVVGLDPATGELRWERALPFATRPEPYGRALLTNDEVYVSTENGIARYRVQDGEEIPLLDGASVQRDGGSLEDAYGRRYEPIGNLIPIPGTGIVAVNADSISIWRKPD
jgi:outer membrane protein assembly factor BamB